ncbi:MAG: ATP-binding protein [Opitutus sp.]
MMLGTCGLSTGLLAQQSAVAKDKQPLTTVEQIWALPEAEKREWQKIQFDCVVYYYDPLWKTLWGRCGETATYLSLGAKVFPVTPGQRIRIEGKMLPSRALIIDEPRVTVLDPSVPLEFLSTSGQIADFAKFDQHLVTVDGYVDQQGVRDGNHLDLHLVVEGRAVLGQLLMPDGGTVPQLKGSNVRLKGVYFHRAEPSAGAPNIEVWIQRPEDVVTTGTLERDERFERSAEVLHPLTSGPSSEVIRVFGTALSREPGQPLRLGVAGGEIVLATAESLPVNVGDKVEAIGILARNGASTILQQSLYRRAQPVFTTVGELRELPDSEQQKTHRIRFEFVVYHFDAAWNALWGRVGDRDEYLAIGTQPRELKPGQKLLIEGWLCPAKGSTVEQAIVTPLPGVVPLTAEPTRGHLSDTSRFNRKRVVFEGYVDRQVQTDRTHVELDVVSEGRVVIGRVLITEDMKVPNWDGAQLRMTGVYSATIDPTGGLPTIELWTSGLDAIEMIGSIDKDAQFELPLTPIESLGQARPDYRVRIEGILRAQQPGKSLAIRDNTGQVTLLTAQAKPLQIGERVEAIGFPVFDGNEWSLRDGLFRVSHSAAAAPQAGLPKLRLADQLREMAPEEAARGYPVQLSGVVTWARPNADFIFVRDVTGGVCVFRPAGDGPPLFTGTRVEVTGVSAPGKFTPVVLASSLLATSSVELPEPRRVTLEQALTGIEEAQWVSMSGYVRAVVPDGPWTRLDLTTSGGEFQAMLSPNERWAKLPGSVVRIKGVCTALTNSKRQLTGIQIWMPNSRFLEIEEAVPQDPFAVPHRSIASLRQFSSLEALNRRVGVTGVVIRHEGGRLLNLQEGTEGLLVLSRDAVPLVPGDRIEAVGFPGRENSRLVLREAVYRKVASGAEPPPLLLNQITPIDAERDGLLARIEGTLVDIGVQEKGTRLMLQNGGVFFEAMFDRPKTEMPGIWVPGSRLELTGVYEIEFDEYRRPHGVRLQLRSVSDVRVLASPSGLTVKRVLAVTGVLAVCVVLGVGWVLALRRRVRQQTGVIRDQVENEKAARLDAALARASKLESVGVLAGGIAHDFNNLLTVVIGNLSLAKLDERIEGETVRCIVESEKAAARAKDLTQQLLTFSKGGEPVRTSARLPEIVREATQFGLHGSNVRSAFDIAPDLWPAEVDKGQIAQVVHNLIINASQAMSTGGLIRISLQNEDLGADFRADLEPGRYVRLTVADTGTGIPAENLSRIFEPYFTTKQQGSGLGLATVYSIVKKHGGQIDVQSTIGEGTTFHVWLPAASKAPAAACAVEACVQAKTGRVLLMDDEVAIRQLGSAVIKRMGLAITVVDDGAAVVSEYAAARAAGRPYDLVILDLTVPGGMGGAEAMVKLREMNQDVRAIVSSGYSSDPVMANHRNYGFSGRVPKPYTATDLIDVVKMVMKSDVRCGM